MSTLPKDYYGDQNFIQTSPFQSWNRVGTPAHVRRHRLTVGDEATSLSASAQLQWFSDLLRRLAQLAVLKDGWDGHGGSAPRRDVIVYVEQLLSAALSARDPQPDLMALPNGGVLISWDQDDKGLEVFVDAPGRVTACFEDQRSGEDPEEWDVSADFTSIKQKVQMLNRP